MDYEKKYKEALERMKSWVRGEHPECFTEAQKAAEFIFPELKESEDKKIMRVIRGLIYTQPSSFFDNGISKEEMLTWLEKQGEQKSIDSETLIQQRVDVLADIVAEQTHAEWSEEDESMLNDIIHNIHFAETHRNVTGSFAMEKEQVNWLKSIKDRIGCETNCTTMWKPSEEQIKALHDLNLTGNISYAGQGQTLINLYNDLKKLTE